MSLFPYPILLADVGGTNARFSLLKSAERPPTPPFRLRTDALSSFAEACLQAVSAQGFPKPRSLIVDGAGPVAGKTIALTNARWAIDGDELAGALGLDQGITINDFEALALGLPFFGAQDVRALGASPVGGAGMRAVLGPGTGLGVGALAETPAGFLPIGSEGGHVTLRPLDAREERVFAAYEGPDAPPSAEMLLQGAGLVRLHAARILAEGGGAPVEDPAALVAAAMAGPGPERDSVALYLDLVARFAGDIAITFLARGGVFIAGGIMPRLLPLVDAARFRRLFGDKPPHRGLMDGIGLGVVTAEEPAFAGLAALGRAPERFLLDYAARVWR
jgi:glucokinase